MYKHKLSKLTWRDGRELHLSCKAIKIIMKNNKTAVPVCSTGPMHREIVSLPWNLFLPRFSCWYFSDTWKKSVLLILTGFCASVISSFGHICLTWEGGKQFYIRLYLYPFVKRAFSLVCIPCRTILSTQRK